MPAKSSNKPPHATRDSRQQPLEADQLEFAAWALRDREKLAESNLDMAKMFLQRGKPGIAGRRLRELVTEFEGSAAATEAKCILRTLKL